MTAAVATRPISPVFQVSFDCFDVDAAPRTQFPSHIDGLAPNTLMWCYRCERAFRLLAARPAEGGVSCAYPECDGAPIDFWSWDAYRAFTGTALRAPEPATRYPLAA